MASPSHSPSTSPSPAAPPPSAAAQHQHPYELAYLLRPPNPNPNPNPSPVSPFFPVTAQPPLPYSPAAAYSYPPATPPTFNPYHRQVAPSYPLQNPAPPPNPNSNPGVRLMQLLGNTGLSAPLESAVSLPLPSALEPSAPPLSTPQLAPLPPPRLSSATSTKLPRGRYLGKSERAIHDIDSRMAGEAQPPQLEVTPITKYTSDPGLVLGRQIAVNKSYIVYGLKMGNIRVLNINTAVRSLLRGHKQRVTDMAFFAEDVHLLASASVDGRVYAWKIEEGPDEGNTPQIDGKVITAIQIGDEDSYHPRICWNSHKQEILFLGIGKYVLRLDTTKVGRGRDFSADEPLKCSLDKLVDGLTVVGKHDGDVTDLSISQWMITRLASASKDGTVKIWDERRGVPLTIMMPYDGRPVNSVAFLTSPNDPKHINLITAGPLNREVKFWAFASEDGSLLPGDSESWQCTQTLELISSSESRFDEAFFNQVIVVPQASIILLANAKKNAIYALHVEFGPDPVSTRMDYIADFTVTMPILSLTGTFEGRRDGEHVVQVYCVQTMAIQQYALELSLCLPPVTDSSGAARDPVVSRLETPNDVRAESTSENSVVDFSGGSVSPKLTSNSDEKAVAYSITTPSSDVFVSSAVSTSQSEVKPSAPPLVYSEPDASVQTVLSPLPVISDHAAASPALNVRRDENQLSEQYVGKSMPDFGAHNSGQDESRASQSGISVPPNLRTRLKTVNPTTVLITPSEIMSGALPSVESDQFNQAHKGEDMGAVEQISSKISQDLNLEVKSGENQKNSLELDAAFGSCGIPEGKERDSHSSDSSLVKLQHTCTIDDTQAVLDNHNSGSLQHSIQSDENVQGLVKNTPEKIDGLLGSDVIQGASAAKGSENVQNSHASGASSASTSLFNSADSLNEPSTSANPTNAALPDISALHDVLQKVLNMQEELQRQLSVVVSAPIAKEGRRMEASLGRNHEKVIKASNDALWARIQEENAKRDKAEKERTQQLTSVIMNINKDLPALLERMLKKEVSALGPTIARAMTPAVSDSLQKIVAEKTNQLDKTIISKLEAMVTRQIQLQFSTTGKQALQESLRTCLESAVIPAFEQSCRTMFEQIDSTFQKGMSEHTTSIQQQVEATNTPLAATLRDAINSASSIINQSLASELLDGQRKLLALVAAGSTNAQNLTFLQAVNGPMAGPLERVETPLDPTKELGRLIAECKFDEAFTMALHRSDVSLVSWVCSQVDLHAICQTHPIPLNQGVLLALLQQLACDIGNDTSRKVKWMMDVAVAINPTDPMIAVHIRPIFEQVYSILAHQMTVPSTLPAESTNMRIIMHVINSVLLSYK